MGVFVRFVSPVAAEHSTTGLELVTRCSCRDFFHGDDRISYVPGEPSCAFALLSDPGGTDVPGRLRHAGAALAATTAKAPT